MRVRSLLAFVAILAQAQGALNLRKVGGLEAGPEAGDFVVADLDSNSLSELIFSTGTIYPENPFRWEVWEYQPVNRFRVVYADTGVYPEPPGIVTGNSIVHAGGDLDGDGLFDIVCQLVERTVGGYYFWLGIIEQTRDPLSPFALGWRIRHGNYPFSYATVTDLDRDGRYEIFKCPAVYENRGDNEYERVGGTVGGSPVNAIGDFDLDGLTDIAGGFSVARVFENAVEKQDTYALVYTDTTGLTNAYDHFSGNDVDQDGKPEFFFCYEPNTDEGVMSIRNELWMWEATGNNRYERTFVDSKTSGDATEVISLCADLDLDGVEEVVWILPLDIHIYKAVGNNRFTEVWHWHSDHAQSALPTSVRAYDLNGNGYPELVYGTYNKTSIFEVEAIRILAPNGGESLHSGETCNIRWRILTPPRCDSVSLFLLTDTVVSSGERFWRLDTIATGLSPGDSSYSWVVPDTTLAWAKIVAIAYGPGWQFDDSDSAFSILPGGVAEAPAVPVRRWALAVSPSFGSVRVIYDVPYRSFVRLGVYDAAGRAVSELVSEKKPAGRYTVAVPAGITPGIYYIRLDAPGIGATRKVVIW